MFRCYREKVRTDLHGALKQRRGLRAAQTTLRAAARCWRGRSGLGKARRASDLHACSGPAWTEGGALLCGLALLHVQHDAA